MRPTSGQVLLDGRAIARTPTRDVAKVLGLLPQAPVAPEGLTVAEALAWTDLTELADHPVDALSGGQRQRAWISMALAQGTGLLLLDEPTTHLDLSHRIDVLELVGRLTEQLLADVFELEARVVPDPVAGTPMVAPVRRLR